VLPAERALISSYAGRHKCRSAPEQGGELSRDLDKAERERDPQTGHLLPSDGKQATKAKVLAEAGVSTSSAQRDLPSPKPPSKATLCGGALGSDGRPRDRPPPLPYATRSAFPNPTTTRTAPVLPTD
jgi:hypothetical protein